MPFANTFKDKNTFCLNEFQILKAAGEIEKQKTTTIKVKAGFYDCFIEREKKQVGFAFYSYTNPPSLSMYDIYSWFSNLIYTAQRLNCFILYIFFNTWIQNIINARAGISPFICLLFLLFDYLFRKRWIWSGSWVT